MNLGDLEIAVMEYLWASGACDTKVVHASLGPERAITHNTVQSTLKRLWEKELLSRTKQSHAYVYEALVTRRELTERMVGDLVMEVAGDQLSVALQAFVNLADRAGEDTLEELEALIAEKRRSR